MSVSARASLLYGLLTLFVRLMLRCVRPTRNHNFPRKCVLVQELRLMHVKELRRSVLDGRERLFEMITIWFLKLLFPKNESWSDNIETLLYFNNGPWILAVIFDAIKVDLGTALYVIVSVEYHWRHNQAPLPRTKSAVRQISSFIGMMQLRAVQSALCRHPTLKWSLHHIVSDATANFSVRATLRDWRHSNIGISAAWLGFSGVFSALGAPAVRCVVHDEHRIGVLLYLCSYHCAVRLFVVQPLAACPSHRGLSIKGFVFCVLYTTDAVLYFLDVIGIWIHFVLLLVCDPQVRGLFQLHTGSDIFHVGCQGVEGRGS